MKTYPSFLTLKEGSTFLTKPLFPQGREDVTALQCYICPTCPSPAGGSLTHSQALALSKRARDVTALRCSEPLRSKVGGPSKVSPSCAGWDRLGKGGGEGDKSGMLLKPNNKYRAISYELDAYERKKIRIKDITYGHIYKNTSFVNF